MSAPNRTGPNLMARHSRCSGPGLLVVKCPLEIHGPRKAKETLCTS